MQERRAVRKSDPKSFYRLMHRRRAIKSLSETINGNLKGEFY